MKYFFLYTSFLFCFSAKAQKLTRETIEVDKLEKIIVSSDEIYKISLSTHESREIIIITTAEGEYFNDITLISELKEGSLILSSEFPEILQQGYDKLSAHKVFSMEVELKIPHGMKVEINSNLASVYLSGKYEQVLVQLKEGSCYFSDFEGVALVNTFGGNILGSARSFDANASSRHGDVNVPNLLHGKHKMVLTSINGDIKLSETK